MYVAIGRPRIERADRAVWFELHGENETQDLVEVGTVPYEGKLLMLLGPDEHMRHQTSQTRKLLSFMPGSRPWRPSKATVTILKQPLDTLFRSGKRAIGISGQQHASSLDERP